MDWETVLSISKHGLVHQGTIINDNAHDDMRILKPRSIGNDKQKEEAALNWTNKSASVVLLVNPRDDMVNDHTKATDLRLILTVIDLKVKDERQVQYSSISHIVKLILFLNLIFGSSDSWKGKPQVKLF